MPTSAASDRLRWRAAAKVVRVSFNAVLGILTIAYFGQGLEIRSGSRDSIRAKATADISELASTLSQYKIDNGTYPTTEEGLNALRVQPADAPTWHGPYMTEDISIDPWGNPYKYESPGPDGEGFLITSYGADGKPGGDGNNADITSE